MSSQLACTSKEFAGWVHDALNRLYDSAYLSTHPLAGLLGDEEPGALYRSQRLRQVLLEAIRAMRPGPGVPANSPDWRAYRILELRYLEGQSPTDAMKALSLAKSQFFRDQARVIEALTDLLWEQFDATCNLPLDNAARTPERAEVIRTEVKRLHDGAHWEAVDVVALLRDLVAVVEPLAEANRASIHFALAEDLVLSRASRVMLRQAALNAIAYAIDTGRGGQVEICSYATAQEVGVRIRARSPVASVPSAHAAQHGRVGLDICRQLLVTMGGQLVEVETDDGLWEARLVWPSSRPRTLLVVDDNAGLVDLFRRYLTGHGWRVVGAASGAEARQILADDLPTAIVLDVMMPEEDGWELLVAIQADEPPRRVPVIICSVLTEPQLAFSLGAAAYLQKPVTQQQLLQVLRSIKTSLEPARQASPRPCE